jgi:hypothetical protein
LFLGVFSNRRVSNDLSSTSTRFTRAQGRDANQNIHQLVRIILLLCFRASKVSFFDTSIRCNNKLASKSFPPIPNITTDVTTGESLIQLLEVIGEESLGRYNKNPKMRIQKVENCNKVLQFIRGRGIQLTNIGGEDIVDGNAKLILGLVWSLILRFSIAEISEEGLTAKEGLLLWCQRKTAPYKPTVDVKDFTFRWAWTVVRAS